MDEKQPTRIYNDGAGFPNTPLAVEAEKAYRHGFARTAQNVPTWRYPQQLLYADLMRARSTIRQRAVVGTDHGVCLFGSRHEIDASKARGRAQAVWIAIEGWEYFAAAGFDVTTIRSVAMRGWNARVQRWAKGLLRPDRIDLPPRPHEDIDSETQHQLDEIRSTLQLTDSDLPRAADIRARSLRQLLDRFPVLQPPVIHGLLRVGETMNVIAPPKVGKSWLASDMALAVATGRPWLDRFPTEAGDVLIIDNELHPTTSAHRIPKITHARGITDADVADHIFVANLRGNLKDIRSLGAYFDHVYEDRFKLIVLDAFYRALPAETDENDNAAMAGVYNTIDRYAEMLGSAFVLIHHTSKGNQSFKSVTDVGAGAGSQSRASDSHLVLRPHEEDNAIVLDAAVRSWPPLDPFCLRWNFPVWTPDETLDATKLRNESRRRKAKENGDQPTEPTWDAQRFTETFLGDEPLATGAIMSRAKATTKLSGRKLKQLLEQAEAEGLAHRWRFAPNQPHRFSTKPQPEKTIESRP